MITMALAVRSHISDLFSYSSFGRYNNCQAFETAKINSNEFPTDSLLERKENYKEMKHGGCQVNGPKVAEFLDR